MKLLRSTCAAMLLSVLAIARAAPAAAQGTEAAAQALFDQGNALMAEGRHADAIVKLEASYKLEHDAGTEYLLAICYEKVGRLASSWAAWNEVADRLDQAGEKAKAVEARTRAAALRPKLAYIKLVLAPSASATKDLVVKQDEVEMDRGAWGVPIPVDPGKHRIVVTAPGRESWDTSIDVPERGAGEAAPVEVSIPGLKPALLDPRAPEKESPRAPGAEPSGSWRLPLILTAGSIGVIGLGIGAGFGGAAIAQWDAALDRCVGGAKDRCDKTGIQLGKEADTFATVSNVGFIIGGAGLAAAGIVWLTMPSSPSRSPGARWVAPVASRGFAGAAFGGEL